MAGALGLIPAHAGKTLRTESVLSVLRAHPRSRGENHSVLPRLPSADGSSPLTRGKPRGGQRSRRLPGLIPAHAGKTRSSPPRRIRLPAHPRSRGENSPASEPQMPTPGSSPLTRGKHPDDGADGGRLGLIPAHAGKTRPASSTGRFTGAHPRSRGENTVWPYPEENEKGSSPLTRGKPPRWRGRPPRVRLIPAHAGKTAAWRA